MVKRFWYLFGIVFLLFSCEKKETNNNISKHKQTESKKIVKTIKTRPAIHAMKGWYPSDKTKLINSIKSYLKTPPLENGECNSSAIISPHAGYNYSGSVAGQAFSVFLKRKIKPSRIIVLGLSHHSNLRGVSVGNFDYLDTPLGKLTVDKKGVEYLLEKGKPNFDFYEDIHLSEHSSEMEFPFIKYLFDDVPVISLLIGRLSMNQYRKIAKVISGLINENSIVIASSDFTHRGPRYHYNPFAGHVVSLKNKLEQLDMGAFHFIDFLDRKGLLGYKQKTGITMCGIRPVGLLLDILLIGNGEYKAHIRGYNNSGEITGDYTNTVSYMGIAFCREDHDEYWGLDKIQQKTLLTIVNRVLDDVTSNSFEINSFDPSKYKKGLDVTGLLSQNRAPFVTLKKKGRLRGCIGYLRPHFPLWESVAKMAMSAALLDRRFTRVLKSELPQIRVEISILSIPRKIKNINDIQIGKHGIIMKFGNKRATYLPQVAKEQKWDLKTTLLHLSRKAGINPNLYQKAQYEVYTAQVFH